MGQIQTPSTRHYAESKRDIGTLEPKCDISIKPFTSRLRETHRRGVRKSVRRQMWWRTPKNKACYVNMINAHKELTVTEVAHTGPAQVCTGWGPIVERKNRHNTNPEAISNWESLANKNLIPPKRVSLRNKLLLRVGYMPSSRWPTENEFYGILGDSLSCSAVSGLFFTSHFILSFFNILVYFYFI